MKHRFSRPIVGEYIRQRIDELVKEHGFDLTRGTVQLNTWEIDRAVAYGEVEALEALAEEHQITLETS